MSEPIFWDYATSSSHKSITAQNIAATALVAAKIYETYEWVHYHGKHFGQDNEYHVCTAEEIVPILHDLARKALDVPSGEATQAVGHLRFLAWATDDTPGDRSVDFYLTIGSTFCDDLDRAVRA